MVIKQDDFPKELSTTWRNLLLGESRRNVIFPPESDYLGVKLGNNYSRYKSLVKWG